MPSKRRLFSGTLALIFFATSVTALIYRQSIYDWWRLRGYDPSSAIVQLATDTSMNDPTRRLFYVHHPQLEDRTTFNDSCPSRGEKTIILGCYITQHGIHLFDVQDPRLEGIEQVTAAHETLHAAYDRLNPSKREEVNAMLERAYEQVSSKRIRDTIESYRSAGDDMLNELHSILGTEVRELPPDLETYYSKYFLERSKIVAYSEKYEKEFTSRENEAKSILSRIEKIAAELQAKRAGIDSKEQDLSHQYDQLERERARTSDAADFNTRVAAYNNQVALYRQLVAEFNRLVEEHNSLLAKYNAVAVEENELIKAIDSRPSSIPSQ
jgi:hypothetical protein